MPLEIIMRVVPTPTTTEFLACTPSFISYACPLDGQAHRLLSRPACLYRPGSFPTAEHYLIRPRSAFLPNYRGRFLTEEPYLSTPVDAHPSTPYPLSRLGHDKIMDLDYGRISMVTSNQPSPLRAAPRHHGRNHYISNLDSSPCGPCLDLDYGRPLHLCAVPCHHT